MGKIYGYARVSTPTQRLDRQIKNIEEYCKDKKIKKILLIATGALMNSTSTQQGESIPGIAHAISIEV